MNPFKQIRKELGLSQEALANRLGVTRRTVYAWEAGESAPTVALMAVESLRAEAVETKPETEEKP